MADKTGIEWTDATWNPVTGCAKVSAGCKHCYAERNWGRLQHLPAYAGRAFTDVATHADRLLQPLSWKRPRRIFVNSMSDLLHQDIHDDFIGMVFRTMARAPQHTFQVLTKRAERMQHLLTHPKMRSFFGDAPWPLPNVWIGVSVEDQATADKRIPLLLDTPAAVRWISAEPLLGPVSLTKEYLSMKCGGTYPFRSLGDEHRTKLIDLLDWVVVGGESGPQARPMHPAWARGLRDQCAAAGVPFLFKQWGEWLPSDAEDQPVYRGEHRHLGEHWHAFKVGKKLAGRLLDGALHDGYPGACLR
jgi:protein gp37